MYQVYLRAPNGIMVPYAQHSTPLGALRAAEYADRYVDVIVRDRDTGIEIPQHALRRLVDREAYPPPEGAA